MDVPEGASAETGGTGSRDFCSPGSTELHHQGKMEKRKPVTSEPQTAGRSLVE